MTAPDRDPDKALVERHAAAERDPAKPLVIGIVAVLIFVGGVFLLSQSGGFKIDIYDTNQLSGSESTDAAIDPQALGRRVFAQNCIICHQPNGEGISRQYPPLAGSEWVLAREGHGDNHIVRIVLDGFVGPVTVKGQIFNSAMAPWGPVLSDRQIAAVLTYVRSEWGNQAPPISPEFVAKIREQTKDRKDPWTAQELQVIPGETSEPLPAASQVPASKAATQPTPANFP